MNFGDWAAAAQNIAAIAAIALGGGWAYYKFVRGRIFHRRAEVAVVAEMLSEDRTSAIRARVTLRNTGNSDVPLLAKKITLSSFAHGDLDAKGRPVWREVKISPVFRDHAWLESLETNHRRRPHSPAQK
jgi:hypothetical protein